MGFNIEKYKNKSFSKNEAVNKKIEALFLLYDKQCMESKLSYKDRVRLINKFITNLSNFEEYEAAAAFKKRKLMKYRKYRDEIRDFMPVFLRFLRRKVVCFFKKLF